MPRKNKSRNEGVTMPTVEGKTIRLPGLSRLGIQRQVGGSLHWALSAMTTLKVDHMVFIPYGEDKPNTVECRVRSTLRAYAPIPKEGYRWAVNRTFEDPSDPQSPPGVAIFLILATSQARSSTFMFGGERPFGEKQGEGEAKRKKARAKTEKALREAAKRKRR